MCGQTFRYVRIENQIPQLRDSLGSIRNANMAPKKTWPPKKGRPPPGGEEAEVVGVSAPGGRADAHPAISRVMLTIHTAVRKSARLLATESSG
jgi:hypothetical protein